MQTFRFCGPGDDPDEITWGDRGLPASPHPAPAYGDAALARRSFATRLNSLIVEPDDLYTGPSMPMPRLMPSPLT